MCNPSNLKAPTKNASAMAASKIVTKESNKMQEPAEPSLLARYTCASILMVVFAVWGKYTFVDESELKVGEDMHGFEVPLSLTVFYLVSLPLLRALVTKFSSVDMKLLLKESMILYNAGQVVLNAWMVYRMIDAVVLRGHPFVGSVAASKTGATYAVWVHYCDKYLEFLDTYFMVLRGRMDQVSDCTRKYCQSLQLYQPIERYSSFPFQVSFLHVYHHFTIAWAWWIGIWFWPEGDCYFGALLNSLIHVMMYSYYTMTLLRISCPWKKYLTMAQLLQFTTVIVYSLVSLSVLPSGTHWKHYGALSCQVGEMTSLFVLFLHFYNKAYTKKSSTGYTNKISTAVTERQTRPESPVRANETSDTGSEQSSIYSESESE